jgi:hypothetical protein
MRARRARALKCTQVTVPPAASTIWMAEAEAMLTSRCRGVLKVCLDWERGSLFRFYREKRGRGEREGRERRERVMRM